MHGRSYRIRKSLIVLCLLPVVLRCAFECIDSAAGTHLPFLNDKGLTFFFTLFSLGHAAWVLGWRRAAVFFGVSVLVSFGMETLGVNTGWPYGPYHYSDMLGLKVAGVPLLIPFAWFMMVYPSWAVAQVLQQDAAPVLSGCGLLARAFTAGAAITAWDVIMDPTKSAEGNWTWEHHGMYFGVPVQNFVGWILTSFTLYAVVSLLFRHMQPRTGPKMGRGFVSLPLVAYFWVALARCFVAEPPQLRVSAAFSMLLLVMIALLRMTLAPQAANALQVEPG